MPEIVLTEDINPKKNMIAGTVLNWPRRTIRSMTDKRGNADWYVANAAVSARNAALAARAQRREERRLERAPKKRGRPPKQKEE